MSTQSLSLTTVCLCFNIDSCEIACECAQVSAGYDAHKLDPLEQLNYQSATYHALVSSLMSLADELCGKSLLEPTSLAKPVA